MPDETKKSDEHAAHYRWFSETVTKCVRRDLDVPPDIPIGWRAVQRFPSLPGLNLLEIDCFGEHFERHRTLASSYSYAAFWYSSEPDIEFDVVEMRRDNGGLREVLCERWEFLRSCSALELAALLLDVLRSDRETHHVVSSVDDIRAIPEDGVPVSWEAHDSCYNSNETWYKIDDEELARIESSIGETKIEWNGLASFLLRAVTLLGVDHKKTNLGIESATVFRDGTVHFDSRRVLSERLFTELPTIHWN